MPQERMGRTVMQAWLQAARDRRERFAREQQLAQAIATRRATCAFNTWLGLYRAFTQYRSMLARRALLGWADHAARKRDMLHRLLTARQRLVHGLCARCFGAWACYAKVSCGVLFVRHK